jgi:dihydrofolate reductase
VREFAAVVAFDEAKGIGKDGDLPWRIPADMAHFVSLTKGSGNNAVVMGRITWDSIPERFRPLVDRRNIVISRNQDLQLPKGTTLAVDFEGAMHAADGCDDVFVIGGATIYKLAVDRPECTEIFVTRIKGTFDCDTFFPTFETGFDLAETLDEGESGGVLYRGNRVGGGARR